MVTGASGLMGAHVVKHILATTDYNSIVLPVTYKHRGIQDRINYILEGSPMALSRVKIVPVDLAQPMSPVTYAKFGKVDYVINCASESHVNRSIENPTPFILNNVSLMCNMLDWARETGVEKFLHISTDEVYGPGSKHRTNKEWKDLHLPSNPYAASKAAQEDIALSYWRTYGVPIGIVNSMNIIGETQDSEKYMAMVMKKIKAMKDGKPKYAASERLNELRMALHILKTHGELDAMLAEEEDAILAEQFIQHPPKAKA